MSRKAPTPRPRGKRPPPSSPPPPIARYELPPSRRSWPEVRSLLRGAGLHESMPGATEAIREYEESERVVARVHAAADAAQAAAKLRARACKVCKWARREWWTIWWSPWSSARCTHPAVHGWTDHDPVTGTSETDVLMCRTARADDYPRTPSPPHGYNTCGKEGRYFEPR